MDRLRRGLEDLRREVDKPKDEQGPNFCGTSSNRNGWGDECKTGECGWGCWGAPRVFCHGAFATGFFSVSFIRLVGWEEPHPNTKTRFTLRAFGWLSSLQTLVQQMILRYTVYFYHIYLVVLLDEPFWFKGMSKQPKPLLRFVLDYCMFCKKK